MSQAELAMPRPIAPTDSRILAIIANICCRPRPSTPIISARAPSKPSAQVGEPCRPEFLLDPAHDHAIAAAVDPVGHEEQAQALASRHWSGVRARHAVPDRVGQVVAAERDPAFLARDRPAAVGIGRGERPDPRDVRSGLGFRNADRRTPFAARKARQPGRLLLGRAMRGEQARRRALRHRQHAEGRTGAIEQRLDGERDDRGQPLAADAGRGIERRPCRLDKPVPRRLVAGGGAHAATRQGCTRFRPSLC